MQRAASALEEFMKNGADGAAVVSFDAVDADALWDLTYWANDMRREAFEYRAYRRILVHKYERWAFATRLYVADTDEAILMRPPNPNLPPRDRVDGETYGEIEIIWVVACDLNAGIEVGRVDVTRTNQLSFGPLLTLEGEHRLLDDAPGFRIVRRAAA
jgi:hypothetical protein